jgi:hypothetical protein
LEGASLEEDDNLHTMWSALLANASSPDRASQIRPGYIAVLRQLAPDEAALLNWIWTDRSSRAEKVPEHLKRLQRKRYSGGYECYHWDLEAAIKSLPAPQSVPDLDECLASLEAAFLLEQLHVSIDDKVIAKFRLTRRGALSWKRVGRLSRFKGKYDIGLMIAWSPPASSSI